MRKRDGQTEKSRDPASNDSTKEETGRQWCDELSSFAEEFKEFSIILTLMRYIAWPQRELIDTGSHWRKAHHAAHFPISSVLAMNSQRWPIPQRYLCSQRFVNLLDHIMNFSTREWVLVGLNISVSCLIFLLWELADLSIVQKRRFELKRRKAIRRLISKLIMNGPRN